MFTSRRARIIHSRKVKLMLNERMRNMRVNPVARVILWLFVIALFAFTANAVAKDVIQFIEGETYAGNTVFCKTKVLADQLAKTYIEKGQDETDKFITEQSQLRMCNTGFAQFKVIRQVSTFKGKDGTIYVTEVESGTKHFIISYTSTVKTKPDAKNLT